MPKARSAEVKLSRLRTLRKLPSSASVLQDLRTALGDMSNLVVAEAATLVGEGRFAELAPDLVAAFERLLEDPVKNDKMCRAKIAVVEALNQMEHADEDFFWRGARYYQPEPVWGGSQDTAAPVRITSALCLVRLQAHGVMTLLVDLLSDPEKTARIGAAQAIAYADTQASGLLLRLKARLGDADPEVTGECFEGLVKLSPADGVTFVAEFLDASDTAIQEAAVLALGNSRRREAFEILKRFVKQADERMQEIVFMALALLRLPETTDFLLARLAGGDDAEARAALAALAVHRYDDRIRERTAAAVAQNGRATLAAVFEKRFREEKIK